MSVVTSLVVEFKSCVPVDEATVDQEVRVICLNVDSVVVPKLLELLELGEPAVELVQMGVLAKLERPELVVGGLVDREITVEPGRVDVFELPGVPTLVTKTLLTGVLWLTMAVEFGDTLIVDVNFQVNVFTEVTLLEAVELIPGNSDDDARPDEDPRNVDETLVFVSVC